MLPSPGQLSGLPRPLADVLVEVEDGTAPPLGEAPGATGAAMQTGRAERVVVAAELDDGHEDGLEDCYQSGCNENDQLNYEDELCDSFQDSLSNENQHCDY